MTKPLILILCTGNSCRSHLAEGILRAAVGEVAEVASAGSVPAGYVHPVAVEVMAEIGVDISNHKPKTFDTLVDTSFDMVIALSPEAARKIRRPVPVRKDLPRKPAGALRPCGPARQMWGCHRY